MKPNSSSQRVDDRLLQLEEEVKRLQSELAVLRSQKLIEALLKADGPIPRENHTVVRTKAGLTVKGTRLTLYTLMDSIRRNNSLKNVRDIYELTDEEMLDILDYIHLHKEEVEEEYQQVAKSSEENRKYWDEKNQDSTGKTYHQREVVLAKLREWREQYRAEKEE